MRRQIASFALMVCGIIALVGGLTMLPAPITASAQAPEPSPRPPLQPTAETDNGNKPTAVILSRLTGTVIDLRTGAPTSGIAVEVDDQIIYSDANGNYSISLPSGFYRLELKPTSSQGTSIQPAQRVALGLGDTVVVHLFFTSLAPTTVVQVVPTEVIAPTPTVAPPVALPPSLPDTSVAHHTSASAPQSLPNTAAPTGMGSPDMWLLFGALMLGLGAMIQFAPRRRRKAESKDTRDM
jgi:hypothetical protein